MSEELVESPSLNLHCKGTNKSRALQIIGILIFTFRPSGHISLIFRGVRMLRWAVGACFGAILRGLVLWDEKGAFGFLHADLPGRAAHAGFLHQLPSMSHEWPFMLRAFARFLPSDVDTHGRTDDFAVGMTVRSTPQTEHDVGSIADEKMWS